MMPQCPIKSRYFPNSLLDVTPFLCRPPNHLKGLSDCLIELSDCMIELSDRLKGLPGRLKGLFS